MNSRVTCFVLAKEYNQPKCTGVVFKNGKVLNAEHGVICNAPLWNMTNLLKVFLSTHLIISHCHVNDVHAKANQMEPTGFFMHFHLGIPVNGLIVAFNTIPTSLC